MLDKTFKELEDCDVDEKIRIFSKFGIYELRALARGLGVSSPTTKKRAQLLESIREILDNSEIEIPHSKSLKGRPFKKLESIDVIMNMLGNNNIKTMEIPKTYNYEDLIVFAQEIPIFEYNSSTAIQMEGVLRIVKRSAYFFDMNSDLVVFVPYDMIEKINLQNGDMLVVSANKINNKDQYTTKQILTINGNKLDEYKNDITEKNERVLPTTSNFAMEGEFLKGGKNLILTDEPLFLNSKLMSALKFFNHDKNSVVFVGLNLSVEDNLALKGFSKLKKFTTDYDQNDLAKDFNKIIDAINYCERLININQNVIIFISDLINILKSLDLYFSSSDGVKSMGHYQQSGIIVKKLLSMSCAFNNNTGCTEFIVCNNLDVKNEFILNEVIRNCRKF